VTGGRIQPAELRAVPSQPDHQPPSLAAQDNPGDTMTNPADAYLDAMHDQANQRLGHIAYTASKAVMDADGFNWHNHATRAAIARAFRQIPADADFTDGITRAVCTVYAAHRHPHNPDSVRQAVARHLGEGHGTLPLDGRP